jgi:hypothetical protein
MRTQAIPWVLTCYFLYFPQAQFAIPPPYLYDHNNFWLWTFVFNVSNFGVLHKAIYPLIEYPKTSHR